MKLYYIAYYIGPRDNLDGFVIAGSKTQALSLWMSADYMCGLHPDPENTQVFVVNPATVSGPARALDWHGKDVIELVADDE